MAPSFWRGADTKCELSAGARKRPSFTRYPNKCTYVTRARPRTQKKHEHHPKSKVQKESQDCLWRNAITTPIQSPCKRMWYPLHWRRIQLPTILTLLSFYHLPRLVATHSRQVCHPAVLPLDRGLSVRGGGIFAQVQRSLASRDKEDIMSNPAEEIGGGAINEKKRVFQDATMGQTLERKHAFDGSNKSNFLHAMEGLERYPNYLSRWSNVDIDELEGALLEKLQKVRQQKNERQEKLDALQKVIQRICEKEPEWKEFVEAPKDWDRIRAEILDEQAVKALFRNKIFRASENNTIPTVEQVLSGERRVDLDAGYLEELMDEEAYDVYSFPLLSSSFCVKLHTFFRRVMEEAEDEQSTHQIRGVRNLDLVGLSWVNDLLLHLITRPISRHLYQTTEMGGSSELGSKVEADLDWRHGFIAAYSATPNAHKPRQRLVPHTDDAEVTLNVCVGDEFEGGKLRFWGLRGSSDGGKLVAEYTPQVGRALLHAGRQLHEVTEVESGDRFALVMWTRSWSGIRSTTCPCCWLNRRTGDDQKNCICGKRWN